MTSALPELLGRTGLSPKAGMVEARRSNLPVAPLIRNAWIAEVCRYMPALPEAIASIWALMSSISGMAPASWMSRSTLTASMPSGEAKLIVLRSGEITAPPFERTTPWNSQSPAVGP